MEAALNGPFGQVTLGATPLTIGGTPDNQLVLADASVSSHHAEIRPQGQDYAPMQCRASRKPKQPPMVALTRKVSPAILLRLALPPLLPLVMVPTNQQPINQVHQLPITDQMPNRKRIRHLHHLLLLLALNQPSIRRVLPTIVPPFPHRHNHASVADSGSSWGLLLRCW